MDSSLLVFQQPPHTVHVDHMDLSPRLLHGETMQGFMTAKFKQAETLIENFDYGDLSAMLIRLLL